MLWNAARHGVAIQKKMKTQRRSAMAETGIFTSDSAESEKWNSRWKGFERSSDYGYPAC